MSKKERGKRQLFHQRKWYPTEVLDNIVLELKEKPVEELAEEPVVKGKN